MIQFISGSFGFVERELVYQALVKDVDCEGKEALHWAAIKGHDAVAQILLANKAQVGKQGHIWWAIYFACCILPKLLLFTGSKRS